MNSTGLVAGVVNVTRQLVAAGIPVLGIKGTPNLVHSGPVCLAQEVARGGGSANIDACSVTRSKGLAENAPPGPFSYPVDQAARLYPILRLLSLDDVLCPAGVCPPIIGNVVVYWDKHHLTMTFAKTLAYALERKLRGAAPFLDGL